MAQVRQLQRRSPPPAHQDNEPGCSSWVHVRHGTEPGNEATSGRLNVKYKDAGVQTHPESNYALVCSPMCAPQAAPAAPVQSEEEHVEDGMAGRVDNDGTAQLDGLGSTTVVEKKRAPGARRELGPVTACMAGAGVNTKRKLCRGGCSKSFANNWGRKLHWNSYSGCKARHASYVKGTDEEDDYLAASGEKIRFIIRLIWFNHVCAIARELGLSDEVLRRRWFMIQLHQHQLLQQNDVFGIMADQLHEFHIEDLLAETQRAYAQCRDRLEFVALDEAQIAMTSCDAAFAMSDGKTRAPILRELVYCMATVFSSQRILVAGTHVDMNVVDDAVAGLPSPFSGFQLVYSLGWFDTVEKSTAYLRHFFGETIGDERCREVHNLMQGRHRILTLFVAHVLVEGPSKMDQVINSIHNLLTGYSRPGSQHLQLPYASILEDSQLDECRLKHVVRRATFRYALTREPTVFSDDAAAIVALGIGLFCEPDASAILPEPLVFYRLLSWILKSRYGAIRSYLRPYIDSPGLASYLWTAFTGAGRGLDWCLTFALPTPFWTSRLARLVLPTGDLPSNHSVSAARAPEEVLEWMREGQYPFLIPDPAFGSDLLFWLEVEDAGTLLGAVTTDPFSAARPHRVATVSPQEPSSFYAESPEHLEKLLAFLRSLPSVPFDPPTARRPAQRLTLNVLRVLCVARATKRNKPYNPPVATLNAGTLLTLEHAPELELSTLDDIVWEPVSDSD
ncbi:hypothetical protein AURDEDRAFT_164319 [Auricularia subglabra TFB-10046 SS5]|nr:hypothetical protein AURDEDRAFT_164319 [Auricularia subglabra TFB-10046 SS5]